MSVSRMYGLTVRSEIPLPPAPFAADQAVDLDITVGATRASTQCGPPGRVLLSLQARRQYYTATATPNGYHLRFFGTCDVLLTPDLRTARVHPVDGVDTDLVSVLLAGTVMAFVLRMRGEAILHASAVETAAGALAFVGASGMGKSTMATVMCAAGARLVSDDLLRLDLTPDHPRCIGGTSEVRLRQAAAALAADFRQTPARRRTADARDALTVPVCESESLPLASIVVPVPDRSPDRTRVAVERVDPKSAVLLLSRFPRLLGWQNKDVLRRQFQQLGEIVERVPVHLAVLPWGPPFRPEVADDLLRSIDLRPGALVRQDAARRGQISSVRPNVA